MWRPLPFDLIGRYITKRQNTLVWALTVDVDDGINDRDISHQDKQDLRVTPGRWPDVGDFSREREDCIIHLGMGSVDG